LVREHSRERAESARIARLMSVEPFRERTLAAIRLITPRDDVLLYLHENGLWRLMQAHGAPARAGAIVGLLRKLEEASGVIRTTRPDEAATFGFDGPDMYRLALCGENVLTEPDGDAIFAIDIGHRIETTGGSYVRPHGT